MGEFMLNRQLNVEFANKVSVVSILNYLHQVRRLARLGGLVIKISGQPARQVIKQHY